MKGWQEPAELIYWEGPVDWSLYERAVFPSRPGKAKLEIRKGLIKSVDRTPRPAATVAEATCLRVQVKHFWRDKPEETFFLLRIREGGEEKQGISLLIDQMSKVAVGETPQAAWRRAMIALLEEKLSLLQSLRPGAVDYASKRVVYSSHSEDENLPEMAEILKRIGDLQIQFPKEGSGFAVHDDWLGDRPF